MITNLKKNKPKRSIIKIENWLNKEEVNAIEMELKKIEKSKEIGKNEGKGFEKYKKLDKYNNIIWDYSRAYLDNIYAGIRDKSEIIKIIHNRLFSEDIFTKIRLVNTQRDEPFLRLIQFSTKDELQYTVYEKGGKYVWHMDCEYPENRIANFIYYLNDDFNGGELELSYSRDIIMYDDNGNLDNNYELPPLDLKITPKQNTLVIMPSDMWHKVKPITKGKRRTLNGHIGFQ